MNSSVTGLPESCVELPHRLGLTPRAKRVAKWILTWHLPVGRFGRPWFQAAYRLHITTREALGWACRFFWYEPLFRSQCDKIGSDFRMEQLPYLCGRGLIQLGDHVQFSGKPSIRFGSFNTMPQLTIGDHTFIGHDTALTIGKQLTIGAHCLIAARVRITDFDGHPLDAAERRAAEKCHLDRVLPVRIGNDVWIGSGASVLKGVHIGDRAIVAAHAVVTRDVPADSVVAGNPARIVRQLSQPENDFAATSSTN